MSRKPARAQKAEQLGIRGFDIVRRPKDADLLDHFYSPLEPIKEYVVPKKQAAKRHYGAHPYFTRRPWNVVQKYLKHYTHGKGALVCDPFGGSGVTLVESLVARRRCVHIDINPLANFITRQVAVGPIEVGKLSNAFDRVKSKFEGFFLSSNKKKSTERALKEFWYPKNVRLPRNADAQYVHELFSEEQLAQLAGLLSFIKEERDVALREQLRFTFSGTLAKTNRTFISARGRAESRGGATIFSVYRYNVPKHPVLLDVWEQFQMRFKKVQEAKLETNALIGDFYSERNAIIAEASATEFVGKVVKPESMDYIFTDPPYGEHIAYLDLSAMWCAWLEFPVPKANKIEEIIEGGDQKKSQADYFNLLKASLSESYKALRYNRYLSLVYCHKDPAYWNEIYTAAQDLGFTYVSSQPQPLNVVWSMHKKKNAISVLSGELIVNFVKRNSRKAKILNILGDKPVQIVKNSAELTIVRNQGATTEDILFELVPRLYENGLLSLVKQKCADITPLLEEEFDFEEGTKKWLIRPNVKIGCFIPLGQRIRFYVLDYLRKCEREAIVPTFDQVVMNVIPNLVNGSVPTPDSILDILQEVATATAKNTWQLNADGGQSRLDLNDTSRAGWEVPTSLPKGTDHNVILWQLLYLANKFGFSPYLGKNERRDKIFENIPHLSELLKPVDFSPIKFHKILQIDCIWLSGKVTPIAAFEIEHSTTVLSALERFSALTEYCPHLREVKRLFLVFPKKRSGKIRKELLGSSYSKGSKPLTDGVRLIYEEDLRHFYGKYHKLFGTIEDVEAISFDVTRLLGRK